MKVKVLRGLLLLFLMVGLFFFAGCADSPDQVDDDASIEEKVEEAVDDEVGADVEEDTGTLFFVADGEERAREGMNSKESWIMSFDHIYVTLTDMRAYQTDPPYDTDQGWDFDYQVMVELEGKHTVDLAQPNAEPALVGEVAQVPAGHYNAISWVMARADSGPAEGYSMVFIGTAEKDGEVIEFSLGIEREIAYLGGDFVGDVRKGILSPGDSAEVEMTFHLDHLFGRDDRDLDDPMNLGAFGFGPLAEMAVDGSVVVDLADLEAALDSETYDLLVSVFIHFGHVGEGHCLAKFVD